MTSLVSSDPALLAPGAIEIGPDRSLTIADVAAVARGGRGVRLSLAATPAMLASRALRVSAGEPTHEGAEEARQ